MQMTPGIHCCREDDDLAKAVRHMEALKIRRLPVTNKSKRMIGILSLGDVNLSASGDLLSECTGTGADRSCDYGPVTLRCRGTRPLSESII
jgi:CBS-domain-containing membrane protein